MAVGATTSPAGFTSRRDLTWLSYGAAAGMNIFAIIGAWPAFGQPLFGIIALTLTLVGVPTSIWLRREGVSRQTVTLMVLAGAIGTAAAVLSRGSHALLSWDGLLREFLVMQESTAASYLIQAFLWVAMFRSFVLLEDEDLPLCAVPAVSTMLLASIILRTVATFMCFLGVVACTVVILALNQRRLQVARARVSALSRGMEAETLRRVLFLLLAAVLTAAPVGFMLASVGFVHDLAWALDARFSMYLRNRMLESTTAFVAPAGSIELAGQAASGSRLLFRVQADADLFWRNNCFDVYTGSGWMHSQSAINRDLLQPAERSRFTRAAKDTPPGITRTRMTQLYQVATVFQGSLVGAYEPVEFDGAFAKPPKPGCNDEAVLTTTDLIRRDNSYQVTSLVKGAPPLHPPNPSYTLSPEQRRRYLALPEIPARVRALARRLTAQETDPRRKAQVIQDYLSTNLTYSKTVARPPRGRDGVDWFLFQTRAGYCDYFASAMTVLCRAAGVPARFVTGFVTGSISADNWFEVRQENAHSLVEVWLDGYGWLEMDPSPTVTEPPGALKAFGARLSAWWAAARAQAHEWTRLALSPAFRGRLAAVALGLAGLITLVWWWRRERAPALPRGSLDADRRRYVEAGYHALIRWLARWGAVKEAGATAAEFLVAAKPILGPAIDPATVIVHHYQAARYAASPLPQAAVGETARALREVLRHRKLIRKTLRDYSPS